MRALDAQAIEQRGQVIGVLLEGVRSRWMGRLSLPSTVVEQGAEMRLEGRDLVEPAGGVCQDAITENHNRGVVRPMKLVIEINSVNVQGRHAAVVYPLR